MISSIQRFFRIVKSKYFSSSRNLREGNLRVFAPFLTLKIALFGLLLCHKIKKYPLECLKTGQKVVFYHFIGKLSCLGHLWCKMQEIFEIFIFRSLFFTKTWISQEKVWIFFWETVSGRKLKFGRDHPYRVFLKIGEQIFDISLFFRNLNFYLALSQKQPFFGHFWERAR